jgi:hypothetical protein
LLIIKQPAKRKSKIPEKETLARKHLRISDSVAFSKF